MNRPPPSDRAHGVPWPDRDAQVAARPDPSLPGSAKRPVPPLVPPAHATAVPRHGNEQSDDRAVPPVRKPGGRMAIAEPPPATSTASSLEAGEGWIEGARTSVRDTPLFSVAAALTIGVLIGRSLR